MDKEKVQARLTELESERAKAMNLLMALDGAIQDSKYWLTELEKEDKNDEDTSE
jgi:hypothetical protein